MLYISLSLIFLIFFLNTKTGILRPTIDIVTEPHHIWPSLSDDQWIDVEVSLKDLILADYGRKNNVNINSLTQSEMRDIILGMEIAPPSIQRQQMAEMEESARDQSNLTATTTKTKDAHGEDIVVTTETAYEQETFNSRTDWRLRCISATNLHMRLDRIYVSQDGVSELNNNDYTYVMPKNILKKFITISDLRIQISGLLYGKTSTDDSDVKEIVCCVLVPQTGTHQNVTLPHLLPNHEYLDDLEPLGWIHTQSKELPYLSPDDITMHSKIISRQGNTDAAAAAAAAAEGGTTTTWDPDAAVILTCSFTPASCTLAAWKPTTEGLEWGKNNTTRIGEPDPPGYNSTCFQKQSLLLSNKLQGFFMIPDSGSSWNYNFKGIEHQVNMKYGIELGTPLEFYNELHRPNHFLNFSEDTSGDNQGDSYGGDDDRVDYEDWLQ